MIMSWQQEPGDRAIWLYIEGVLKANTSHSQSRDSIAKVKENWFFDNQPAPFSLIAASQTLPTSTGYQRQVVVASVWCLGHNIPSECAICCMICVYQLVTAIIWHRQREIGEQKLPEASHLCSVELDWGGIVYIGSKGYKWCMYSPHTSLPDRQIEAFIHPRRYEQIIRNP